MTTMTYHVHAVEQDMAAKWYARVCITDTEAVFLKFQEFPTMDQIQEAAEKYVASLVTAEEVIDGTTE
jgi:hypothetical protein